MKFFKAMIFGSMFLLTLTGSKCFVVSSFDTSGDDEDEENRDGLTIGITNGDIISKDVMQTIAQTFAVAEITSQSMQFANNAITAQPFIQNCKNSHGELTSTVYDLDSSSSLSGGDEVILIYNGCLIGNETVSGDLAVTVQNSEGVGVCNYTSGSNWQISFNVSINDLQIGNGAEVYTARGQLEVSLKYLASATQLETNIISNSLIIESSHRVELSDAKITQLLNLAVAPSSYTLSIDTYRLYSFVLDGYVDVQAESLHGIEQQSNNSCLGLFQIPEIGNIKISGKNSNAVIQFMSGDQFNIEIDSDGDLLVDEEIFSSTTK